VNYDNSIQAQQDFVSVMAAWGSTIEVLSAPVSTPCPRVSKYLIKLDEVVFKGTVFELTQQISVALYQEDDLWYCEYEPCGIVSVGDTAEEAAHSFSEDFSVLWDEIAQCSDDSLTVEAKATKRCLLSLVKSVKTR
jgi:hypothetical protein